MFKEFDLPKRITEEKMSRKQYRKIIADLRIPMSGLLKEIRSCLKRR